MHPVFRIFEFFRFICLSVLKFMSSLCIARPTWTVAEPSWMAGGWVSWVHAGLRKKGSSFRKVWRDTAGYPGSSQMGGRSQTQYLLYPSLFIQYINLICLARGVL